MAAPTVTTATSVLGAAYTPGPDVHSSSGQGNTIPAPVGVVSDANPFIPGDIDVDMAPPAPEHDLALIDGKYLFLFLIFYINIYIFLEPDLEVEIDPQGSSHSHGGHLHGNAHGNNFNFADRHQLVVVGHCICMAVTSLNLVLVDYCCIWKISWIWCFLNWKVFTATH